MHTHTNYSTLKKLSAAKKKYYNQKSFLNMFLSVYICGDDDDNTNTNRFHAAKPKKKRVHARRKRLRLLSKIVRNLKVSTFLKIAAVFGDLR